MNASRHWLNGIQLKARIKHGARNRQGSDVLGLGGVNCFPREGVAGEKQGGAEGTSVI